MKKMLLSSVLALASVSAFAAPQAEDTRIYARKAENVAIATGAQPGTIQLEYTIVHSNSCVASVSHVGTTSVLAPGNRLVVAVDTKWVKKVACPAVYHPTPVRYTTTLANLSHGETYEIELIGQPDRVRVRAGR